MIEPVMAISNLVLTQQIYSEETTGAHAHYRESVPLTHWGAFFIKLVSLLNSIFLSRLLKWKKYFISRKQIIASLSKKDLLSQLVS